MEQQNKKVTEEPPRKKVKITREEPKSEEIETPDEETYDEEDFSGFSPEELLEESEKALKDGQTLFKEGKYEEATNAFVRGLKMRIVRFDQLSPECARWYMWYGRALLAVGKTETGLFGGKVETKPAEEDASPASVMPTPPVSENPPSNTSANAAPQTEEDLVDDVQLAWENMELARKLFSQSEKEEDKKDLALCYGYCGEIRCESESFTEAIEDFINAAKLHEEIEGRSSRNAAGDYVMAGSSAAYNHQFGAAYEYYLEALTHSDNALRKLIGSEAPETVLETDETFLDPLQDDDIEEWVKKNEKHEDKEEVLELYECCKELTEKLDFLDSNEHEEVSNTDVTAMVQQMLQQELGGLLGAAVGSEDLPVNDLGVAKSSEPKEAEEKEVKKPVAEEKTEETVIASKVEAKVSIESSAPTGVKRTLEDATEEQPPQKKQKIE